MASSSGRLSTAIATITLLGGAAGLFWMGATAGAVHIERITRAETAAILQQGGHDWAKVSTDGLQVHLTGTAPSEVERFRLLSQVGMDIDPRRIRDGMTVMATDALTPPDFKLELLRSDEGISLIGLVPVTTDRTALLRQLRNETAAPGIADLLEAADYPAPAGWDDAIRAGLGAAQLVQRAKISVAPGLVQVVALADSAQDKARLERELQRNLPAGLRLETDISAPRPVISPFTLRFVIDDKGARFETCSASTETGRERIVEAAIRAGATGNPACILGLGAPTPDWADGAVPAIAALADLGQGSLTISDADITMQAPADIAPADFDRIITRLADSLPAVFSLHAEQAQPDSSEPGPAEFFASSDAQGVVSLRGGMSDQRMLEAVDSFARSRFAAIEGDLRSDAVVPAGWTLRLIAALEALSLLETGTVAVTPEILRIAGNSGDPAATDQLADLLTQRLGPGKPYEMSIRYDRRLDPTLGLPDGEECVTQLNIVMSESEIGFEPSRSAIAGDPTETLERLAAIMADCAEFQIEAGGHTDSQGSAGFNADLSRARAQTLVTAMTEAGIDTRHMTSQGYGESQPIADNDTAEGREANRRIEFRLMSPIAVRNEALPAPLIRQGVTGDRRATAPDSAAAFRPPDTAWQAAISVALPSHAAQPSPVEYFGPPLPQPRTGPIAPADDIGTPAVQHVDEETPRPSARPGMAAEALEEENSQ